MLLHPWTPTVKLERCRETPCILHCGLKFPRYTYLIHTFPLQDVEVSNLSLGADPRHTDILDFHCRKRPLAMFKSRHKLLNMKQPRLW
jgi:hypothetical protein